MTEKETSVTISSEEKKTGGVHNLIPGAKDPRTITPEQKKAGREQKKRGAMMMQQMAKYQDMTREQLQEEAKRPDITVLELLFVNYVTSGMKNLKVFMDMLNRYVPQAPRELKLTGGDEEETGKKPVQIEIVRRLEGASGDIIVAGDAEKSE